jgi:hypothetical protein
MTTTAPVVAPVPEVSLAAAQPMPGALLSAIAADPGALVYFLVNVGDGDTQLLLLPPDSNDGIRRLMIVDVATPKKLPALIGALHAAGLIEQPGTAGQIKLLVATHPHFDHIGGMSDLFEHFNGPSGCIDQFWEPGYFFPTPPFHNLMAVLESSPWIRRLQPTAGTTLTLDAVRITVTGPGVGLRNVRRGDQRLVDHDDDRLPGRPGVRRAGRPRHRPPGQSAGLAPVAARRRRAVHVVGADDGRLPRSRAGAERRAGQGAARGPRPRLPQC